ncbi:TetR family transcriptional regulator [Amycolatopsis coloradensis]|uniref:TetR family transcriptional regulator n=1 Tax=Amycolatopsis coloradensis TaxID=76021 RepID=A0A1R0KN50_9PSEU|nr:TetR/AcrR family transcriptional regulator [Amycolatopsis coloradensis]OLZ48260.1 TetR family transcriptional regulator [Amycolatopsis coloradensis]
MVRDKEATKRKLLDAATSEFATYGIAGARVDRIAKNAGANKALIYAYFCSKEYLFEMVVREQVDLAIKSVPITPDDLPGYAGRLFDRYLEHPEVLRLIGWLRLEQGFDAMPEAERRAYADKVAAIKEAQRAGSVPDHFDAEELLSLVVHLSILGLTSAAATRDLVVRSVARLTGT